MQHIRIAIDGPSGAGKSSLSKAVARALGIIYVDTGALYRTVGYYARSIGIPSDKSEIVRIVPHLGEITIEVKYEDGVQCVYLNGENLGDRIRENEISMYASTVSAVPEVRAFLLDTQKDIAAKNSVIMDGRKCAAQCRSCHRQSSVNISCALGHFARGNSDRLNGAVAADCSN